MRIGIIAEPAKRELLQNYCIAYKMFFRKHDIFAPEETARKIEEATGLAVHRYLSGNIGGIDQMKGQIERNEMDALIYFYAPDIAIEADNGRQDGSSVFYEIVRLCDEYCIPVATNLASAEILILGINNGDLDWRL